MTDRTHFFSAGRDGEASGAPLRVLMVEDSDDDARLVEDVLRMAGYAVRMARVDTEPALREALREEWDIVLADYCLPSFDAPATLALVRGLRPSLPVIVVSGTIGEEVAVETLKLGAEDYLLKQNLTRLVPAVARALEAAESLRQRLGLEHMKTIILENSPDLICTFDERGHFIEVSAASRAILGYEPESLRGRHVGELAHPDDRAGIEREFQAVLAGCAFRNVEKRSLHQSGDTVHLSWSAAFSSADGIIVAVGHDVTERKQAEQRLLYLANHDSLTGLPNREHILARIEAAAARARRTDGLFALLYVDLDRFKVINDGYGHLFGDDVLRATGARLAGWVRDAGVVARHGGDEFLILLPTLRCVEDAHAIARRLLEGFAQPLDVQGRRIHLSGSIGVSVFPADGDTPETLIHHADVAMYRAKERGQNTYYFFTPEMSEQTRRRVSLETGLRQAAQAGQLQLVYQPKVSLDSGRITGCEALLRWHHPELGSISPGQFIPIAEESGLIVPIGDWALREACAQAKAWLDAGLAPVCIAVNLSARQFLQQDVVAWVMRTLEETGLPPTQIELELTESLIAQDVEKVTETLMRLKAVGVKLSIDDFGTGYSSLSYLKRFRVDTLKIDQSFVRNMLCDQDDATIVLAIIALAHNLKFKVIAEGVETERQRHFLKEHRCDEIQGYCVGRPVPAVEFAAMLRGGASLA